MQETDNSRQIPCVLFDEEYYERLEAIPDYAERSYRVARSLVANGFAVLPCLPYDPDTYNNPDLHIRDRKKASGKAPVKKSPYDNLCSDLETVYKWFHPQKGQYRGYNVGLATGTCSNLLVVDIDVDPEEGVDGWVKMRELMAANGQISTVKVRSGGKSVNGQHIYFKHTAGFANSVSKLPGIDLRTNKGHIMAPLARCQGVYEIVEFASSLPDMPEWLISALNEGKHENVSALPGADKDVGRTEERPEVPLALIRSALEYLPVWKFDGAGIWMKMAMAIHSEHPNEDGWALLDEWSRGDAPCVIKKKICPDGYDKAGNRLRWDSFKDGESSITIGTLLYVAKTGVIDGFTVGGGWADPRAGRTVLSRQDAMTMMNNAFVEVNPAVWQERMSGFDPEELGKAPPGYIAPGTIYMTGVAAMPGATKRYGVPSEVDYPRMSNIVAAYCVENMDDKGKIKQMPLGRLWLDSLNRRIVRGVGYYVNEDRCPVGVLNGFSGWGVEPKKGNPAAFLQHLRDIICNGDEEKYSWIINRLAYVVQHGDVSISTSLVINGAEGLGKNLWWEYLQQMFGYRHTLYTSDPETFTGRFTEELVGKFVVLSDEALFSGDVRADNKAKGLIGNEVMREEGKGKSAKQAQNVAFFIFFSNHDDPVAATRGNRRYTIMTGSDKYCKLNREDPAVDKEAREYFKRLAEEKNGDGPSHLLHMLLSHPVDVDFARRSLDTDEKAEMTQKQDIARDSLLEWLIWLLESEPTNKPDPSTNEPSGRWGTKVPAHTMYQEYAFWVKDNKHNKPSRSWKAVSTAEFKHRLCGLRDSKEDWKFEATRSRAGNMYKWPERIELNNLMHEQFPTIVEREFDVDGETEF